MDKTPPTSSISTPPGQSVVEGSTVAVTGTAIDAGGGVEVSTDWGEDLAPGERRGWLDHHELDL